MTNKKQTAPHEETEKEEKNEEDKSHKIQSLREMINSAERTIQSAKAMLLQLEGKKKTGRKRKVDSDGEGTVIQGIFDGQIMIGTDGKQYPIPVNYASKSKLIEGDMLKLTITPDGSFIYKQVGPTERKNIIGIVGQDEGGNYYVIAEGKSYRVLLASITYFRADPGDEVVVVIPRNSESSWAAIENVLQKGKEKNWDKPESKSAIDQKIETWKDETREKFSEKSITDEWTSDIEELEQEIQKNNIP